MIEPETGEAGVLEPGGEVLDFILSAVGDNEEVKAGNNRITFVAQKEWPGGSTETAFGRSLRRSNVGRKGLTGLEREERVKDRAHDSLLACDWIMVPLTTHYLP